MCVAVAPEALARTGREQDRKAETEARKEAGKYLSTSPEDYKNN